jgi:hypothetical protein
MSSWTIKSIMPSAILVFLAVRSATVCLGQRALFTNRSIAMHSLRVYVALIVVVGV